MAEFVREPPAQRLVFSGTGDEGEQGTMEMIQIGDTSYFRGDEGQWLAAQSADAATETLGTFWQPEDFFDEGQAKLVGRETVNGMKTKHYHYKQEAWLGAFALGVSNVKEAESDIWVSEEYGAYVKALVRIVGEKEDGTRVTVEFGSEVTDINSDIVITAPEGVAKPGLPDDIPAMEGATEMNAFGTMVSYQIAKPVDEVIDFYEEQMKANNWEIEEVFAPGMMDFTKDGRSAKVMINEGDTEGVTSVVIMTGEEEE